MTAVAGVTAGADITEAWGDSVAAAVNPYGCVLKRTADQSINDSTDTFVTFPTGSMTEELDTGSFHSGGTNTHRITIPTGGDGWYDVFANVSFEIDNDGIRHVYIEKNAATVMNGTLLVYATQASVAGGSTTRMCVYTTVLLAAGDYVSLGVSHNAGSARNVLNEEASVRFGCVRRWGV